MRVLFLLKRKIDYILTSVLRFCCGSCAIVISNLKYLYDMSPLDACMKMAVAKIVFSENMTPESIKRNP